MYFINMYIQNVISNFSFYSFNFKTGKYLFIFGVQKNLSETLVWGIQQSGMVEIKPNDDKAEDGGTLQKF